ncbi:reverse transcriptase [Tanacetum coccineum]
MQRILHDSPWLVKGHCLILRPSNPHEHITEMDFSHEMFWVQAHGLPFGKLTRAYATEIAPKFGTLVDVDCDAQGFQFDRSYLRFRVKVNLRKPLCPGHDEQSCGYDRDETISRVGARMRALLFKRPIGSLRNQRPFHQTPVQPSTPHILNDKVSNDTINQSPSTSPIEPIQISTHKPPSHVASSSSIDPSQARTEHH